LIALASVKGGARTQGVARVVGATRAERAAQNQKKSGQSLPARVLDPALRSQTRRFTDAAGFQLTQRYGRETIASLCSMRHGRWRLLDDRLGE
jgi:hypothetical protein